MATASESMQKRPRVSPGSGRITRRCMMVRLAGWIGTLCVGLGFEPTATAERGRVAAAPHSQADRRIAAIAGRFRARHPEESARIINEVESRLGRRLGRPSGAERSRATRDLLLDPFRVARELEREEIMILDGWVLSRSEAMAAIYLDAMSAPS